jgi:small ligand-binding sensory domain FIST
MAEIAGRNKSIVCEIKGCWNICGVVIVGELQRKLIEQIQRNEFTQVLRSLIGTFRDYANALATVKVFQVHNV